MYWFSSFVLLTHHAKVYGSVFVSYVLHGVWGHMAGECQASFLMCLSSCSAFLPDYPLAMRGSLWLGHLLVFSSAAPPDADGELRWALLRTIHMHLNKVSKQRSHIGTWSSQHGQPLKINRYDRIVTIITTINTPKSDQINNQLPRHDSVQRRPQMVWSIKGFDWTLSRCRLTMLRIIIYMHC